MSNLEMMGELKSVLHRRGFADPTVTYGDDGLATLQAETSAYFVAVRLIAKDLPPPVTADCETTVEIEPWEEEMVRTAARRLRSHKR